MFWFYNLLVLLSIPAFPLIKRTAKKRGEIHLLKRLSSKVPEGGKEKILLHVSSIGEINTVKPLIEALKDKVTLTTFTDYGLDRAKKLFPDIPSRVVPLDFYPLIKNFLKKGRFKKILIYETEIWPSLLKSAKELEIPTYFVSGKISEKTFNRLKSFKSILQPLLKETTFLAKSQEDAKRAISLGFEKVEVVGNLKLAFTLPKVIPPLKIRGSRKVVIWGSTHEGEEEIAVKVHKALKKEGINILTIIAPRHVNRKLPLPKASTAFRSRTREVKEETEFYVIDTIGELAGLYSYGDVAVVGGSFIKGIGGHNPVEAAAWKKAVVTGTYCDSFKDVVKQLKIPTISEHFLADTLKRLLTDNLKREALEKEIYENYLREKNVLKKILKAIGETN